MADISSIKLLLQQIAKKFMKYKSLTSKRQRTSITFIERSYSCDDVNKL